MKTKMTEIEKITKNPEQTQKTEQLPSTPNLDKAYYKASFK
jgi:hypothetical protein